MRDRDFEIAKNALVEGTEDKTTIPDRFDLKGDGILYGKKRKRHTLIIPVDTPAIEQPYYRAQVIGDGRILDEQEGEAGSWVRNRYNSLVSMQGTNPDDSTWGAGYINAKDTSEVLRYGAAGFMFGERAVPEGTYYGYSGLLAYSDRGCVVGTGDTAWSFEDWTLANQIVHGVAGGEFYHATEFTPPVTPFDSGFTRDLSRYFDNFSGGTITIKEMGLVAVIDINGQARHVLMCRDLISPTIDVPNMAQLKLSHIFSLSYPGTGGLLRNLYNYHFCQMASVQCNDGGWGDGYKNLKGTSGVEEYSLYCPCFQYNASLHSAGYGYMCAADDDSRGIVVGSDNTAVTFDDYALNTPIATGAGAGELNYGLSETPVRNWASLVMTTSHGRIFANASGGAVTVREVGLVGAVRARQAGAVYTKYIMMLRNVPTAVALADGEDLRVVYQLKVTYPE